jgi:FkbH-like protein
MTHVDGLTPESLLRKRKGIVRELLQGGPFLDVRVAVLGSSTTNEVVDLLEVLLLQAGVRPTFHQADYNRYWEDTVLDPTALVQFKPDVVLLHTSSGAIKNYPPMGAKDEDLDGAVAEELARYRAIWNAILQRTTAVIVQNNFEAPLKRILGNLDAVRPDGRARFCNRMNEAFAVASQKEPRLFIHDLAGVASTMGLERFIDAQRWFQYKIITTPEGSLEVARSVAGIIRAVYGRTRKCLVLDLDNTLWGGVIGDDGADKIRIGRETAEAEAYTDFQEYCLRLHQRGILLAVCSKNNDAIAREGFQHPDAVLKLDHFAAFRANWEPKHENLLAIARELNIGVDSLVFVDDNPAERAIVTAQLPSVGVPDVGSDVTQFIRTVEKHRYFESVSISREDLARADQYAANARRARIESTFADYGAYLASLKMEAEIGHFRPVYMDRITQLLNKTNQFNLTTRRYTAAELEQIASDSDAITLYGRLSDAFGDNGLISVIIGRCERKVLRVESWVMSCRVLKRDMELAMLDAVVAEASVRGVREVHGTYLRTAKNELVADHYEKLGFTCVERAEDGSGSAWRLELDGSYTPRNTHIKVN